MGGVLIFIFSACVVAAVFTVAGSSKVAGLSGIHNFSDLIDFIKKTIGVRTFNHPTKSPMKPDMNRLNCRVGPSSILQDGSFVDVFSVDICGLVHSAAGGQTITIKISIQDVTEGTIQTKAVNAKIKQWQLPDSKEFSYSANLGRIPGSLAVLNDWTTIAQLPIVQLVFARRGNRKLQFTTKVSAGTAGGDIASAKADCIYDNPDYGYMDLQENLSQTKNLTVALAFAVSAAGGTINDCQVELIRKWAREHLDIFETTDIDINKLDAAINEVMTFFGTGHQLDIPDICRRLMEIAPPARRYDVLELAMHSAAAQSSVTAEQLNMLKELANMLELDGQRVRSMTDKIIPLLSREIRDAGVVLGVTSDMSGEKAREYLNKEYAKWNARVTSCDQQVQTQADQMLRLIAEARDTYVEKVVTSVENK